MNQTPEERSNKLPIFLKNAIKKAKDLQILDKELIKNLNLYKTNEKKPLYQNIKKKLTSNNSTKETHKKYFSASNEKKLLSNYKTKAPLTSKYVVDSLEKIHLGSQSEETRSKIKKMHSKKLTELMKCYEIEDFNLKNLSNKFKSTSIRLINYFYFFLLNLLI